MDNSPVPQPAVRDLEEILSTLRTHLDEESLQIRVENAINTNPDSYVSDLFDLTVELERVAEGDWNNMTVPMLEHQAQVQGLIAPSEAGLHTAWQLRLMLEAERRAREEQEQALSPSSASSTTIDNDESDASSSTVDDDMDDDWEDESDDSDDNMGGANQADRNDSDEDMSDADDGGFGDEPQHDEGYSSMESSAEYDEDFGDDDEKAIYTRNNGVRMRY